jgi:hypothetical protein
VIRALFSLLVFVVMDRRRMRQYDAIDCELQSMLLRGMAELEAEQWEKGR